MELLIQPKVAAFLNWLKYDFSKADDYWWGKNAQDMVGLFPGLCFHIYNEIWNQVSFMLPFLFAYVDADIFHTSASIQC